MSINTGSVQPGQNVLALKRTQLEAEIAAAISRAQKQYIQVQRPDEQRPVKGPAHLGTKIDVTV